MQFISLQHLTLYISLPVESLIQQIYLANVANLLSFSAGRRDFWMMFVAFYFVCLFVCLSETERLSLEDPVCCDARCSLVDGGSSLLETSYISSE
jgi:hypothetical protein